jgi:hypothetical protein
MWSVAVSGLPATISMTAPKTHRRHARPVQVAQGTGGSAFPIFREVEVCRHQVFPRNRNLLGKFAQSTDGFSVPRDFIERGHSGGGWDSTRLPSEKTVGAKKM